MKLIWDLSIRLCHWIIVILVVSQWVTTELLDEAIEWHALGGYLLLGILLYRFAWGFIGTKYARFKQFLYSPKITAKYFTDTMKGRAKEYAGHNPMGGWMSLLMLLLLLAQSVSGLFMTDDIFFEAPFNQLASETFNDTMNTLHHRAFSAIQALVVLHLCAVIFYEIIKKQRLIKAMLTGKKKTSEPGITTHQLKSMLCVAIAVAIAVYLAVEVLPPEPELGW